MKGIRMVRALLFASCLVGAGTCARGGAVAPKTVDEQIDELRARLDALEAERAQDRESREAMSRDLYAQGEAQKKLAMGEKIRVSGYIQGQFTTDRAAKPQSDFRVRRARLKVDGQVSDLAAVTFQIDAARTVDLKDAYIDLGRSTDVWRFRVGQAKVPFMYEVLESSSSRLEPERTVLATTLFPGERDIGAWLNFKNVLGDRLPGTTLDIGAMSGNGASAADNNNNKDIVARLRFVLGSTPAVKDTEANSAYIGCQTGKFTNKDGVTTDKRRVGAGVSYSVWPFWFRGEIVSGENLGMDFLGWYAHLAYRLENGKDTLFMRYERYDEDRDAAQAAFKNLTVGGEHQYDAKTRVVLAHEFRSPESGYSNFSKTDGGMTTVRVQVKY